jgi:hypothetical protein
MSPAGDVTTHVYVDAAIQRIRPRQSFHAVGENQPKTGRNEMKEMIASRKNAFDIVPEGSLDEMK